MTSDPRSTFRFGEFVLDVAGYQLRRDGRPVRLERQPMDLLILLVERRQQLVSRDDIVERLWGQDVFVDVETGVNTAIRKIRQALRDSPDAPTFIETVPGKGYRFIGPVEAEPAPRATAVPVEPAAPTVASAVPAVAPGGDVRRLPRALVVILLAVAILAGLSAWAWREAHAPASRVRLAILPFDNLSEHADRDYLAAGLAEEITVSLGQADPDHLDVIGRTSMMIYKGAAKSLAEIGGELNADYLVEGSIHAESSRFRATARLIRVRDQVQVWSQSFDREPTSMLVVQQELSAAIAQQIRSRLSPARLDALARRQTRNSDAYDLYLRGLNFANQRTPPTTRLALEYLGRATALDPEYALAWAGLSRTDAASLLNGDGPPLDVCPRARAAARQALRADPNLAEALFALGYVHWTCDWDWPAAEAALRQAIAVDPSHAGAHLSLGHLLSQMGRHTEALPLMQRARELDPFYGMPHALSSQVAFQSRDFSAALEHARRAIVLGPEFWIGHMMLGQALAEIGQIDEARDALTVAARLSNQNSKALSARGYVLAKGGRVDEARQLLATMETASRQQYVPPYALALVHAGLGETDAAFSELDRAYAARDVHLMFLTVDAKWDPFRADPRFAALISRTGFVRPQKPGL